jgi:hypothetical protein
MIGAMRIGETRNIAAGALRALEGLRPEGTNTGGPDPLVRIVGIEAAREALQRLRETNLGSEVRVLTTKLLEAPLLGTAGVATVQQSTWNHTASLRAPLMNILSPTVAALAAAAPPEPNGTILVKLPQVDNLDDTAKTLQSLSHAFDRPLGMLHESPVQMLGVDSGSTWLVLAARTAGALKFLQHLAEALGTLLKALAAYKTQMGHLQAIKAEMVLRQRQEALNAEAQEALVNRLAEELAVAPTGAERRPVNAELVSTLVHSLKTLQDLSQRGAEVRILAARGPDGPTAETRAVGAPAEPAQLPPGEGTPRSG